MDFVKVTRAVDELVHNNYYALPPKTILLIYVYPYLLIKFKYYSGAVLEELSNGRSYTSYSNSYSNDTKQPSKVMLTTATSI